MRLKFRILQFLLFAVSALPLVITPVATAEHSVVRRHPQSPPLEDPLNAAVIVKYKSHGAWSQPKGSQSNKPEPRHASKINRALGLNTKDGRVLDTHMQSLKATGISSTHLADRLRLLPDVEWVEVDQINHIQAVPNDPYLADQLQQITPAAGQWYLRAPSGNVTSAINAIGAWDITQGNRNVIVAVLDTGIRPEHPDLSGKMVAGYDFVSDPFMGNDNSGRDNNPTDPGDWSTNNMCAPGEPGEISSWHGTQVAGLIGAATNNGIGIAGVGYNVRVLPIRVLGRCGGLTSDIIAGMLWAAGLSDDVGTGTTIIRRNTHPSRILNLSLGSIGRCSNAYRSTIQRLVEAQIAVVVAAGNESTSVSNPGNCPGTITVGALRHTGSKAGFSSLGSQVSLSAPGGNCVNTNPADPCLYPIMSTINWGENYASSNGYSDAYLRPGMGTSFSTPLVAGTLGLMLSLQPNLSLTDLKSALLNSTTAFPSSDPNSALPNCVRPSYQVPYQYACICTTVTCGSGMLNTQAAVTAVAPPTVIVTSSSQSGVVGGHIVLNATGSSARGGRNIASYAWHIIQGQRLAEFVGTTNSNLATLNLKQRGPVVVQLTVTDSQNFIANERVFLYVKH